ncbi:hypothetical protein ACOMHN_025147 [Nucella lapillus]
MLLSLVLFALTVFGVHSQHVPSEIAFSAGLASYQVCRGGETVVFDRIFSNVGAAYHSDNGKFMCIESGIYVFQVHALSGNDTDMWLELHHNYQYVVSVWGHTDNDYATGGNSVILQLIMGDEVTVACTTQYHSELYGASDEVYATFSGYLISPVYQEFPGVGRR